MYSIKKNALLVLQLFTCIVALGQIDSTYQLDDVEIVGIDLSRFSSGTVLQKIEPRSTGGLSSIGQATTIHFKNYGNQQLSTIAFRGTSASQTNVVWNGIQVNSPTLGQTDFSVWPMFLTDQIIIQKGGGSSLFGSGAIGGSIILDNSQFLRDSLITLYKAYGSFGQFDGGIKLHVNAGDRVKLEYKGYYGRVENDFPLKGGGEQTHAGVRRVGVSQKIKYQHKNGHVFSEVAYSENDRDVQPTITSASRSTLVTRNLRGMINSVWKSSEAEHNVNMGITRDETVFNDSSVTSSYRLTSTYAFSKAVTSAVSLRLGGTMMNEWAKSENFEDTEQQDQLQLFSSLNFYPIPNLGITTNLRGVIQKNNEVFIPSVGFEYTLFQNSSYAIDLRGQISRDFRAPTFNDLFWNPGGNPDLLPEKSNNIEGGIDLKYRRFSINLTGFYSDINNWIQWRPIDGIWTPRNLRRVKTRGFEVNMNTSWVAGQFSFDASSAYSYVRSEDQGIEEKNQLPYVPKHEIFGRVSSSYKRYTISLVGNFTGVRYTTLTNSLQSKIDEFLLIDMAIARTLSINGLALEFQISSTNIFNKNYQVVKNHAMPGRAFLIEVSSKF